MDSRATSFAAEAAEHRARWRLLPQSKHRHWFDRMLANEFRPPADLRALQAAKLRRIATFAARETNFYRQAFGALKMKPEDIRTAGDLARLPVLSKREVIDGMKSMVAANLPRGETRAGWTQSGGTTGRPARVYQTWTDWFMFAAIKAREARWMRFDPRLMMGELRLTALLPAAEDGRTRGPDETVTFERWRNVGAFFETGPAAMTSSERPAAETIAWLREWRVAYLMCTPSVLEQLAFHVGDTGADLPDLKGMLSISAQLTGAMRSRIESCFQVPVHQNYGLSEIGVVASRCLAGRYHVHIEHCLLEIVDEAGQPAAPGESGRLLTTSLNNFAMPMLRYDTGDRATLSEGPCPCGRTLPSFERIEGRYRRYAFLPPGTRQRVNSLSKALADAPPGLTSGLRFYQVHQRRDGAFQLRLQMDGPVPPDLEAHLRRCWQGYPGDPPPVLEIARVEAVTRCAGGKFLEFTSDFNPPDQEA